MYHHSHSDYATAASAAAAKGREKMEAIIAQGRGRALEVVSQVQDQVPKDRIALANRLTIQPNGDGFSLYIPGVDPVYLHDNALEQVAEKVSPREKSTEAPSFPKYFRKLSEKGEWGKELAAQNVNTLLSHSDSRHLIRSVTDKGSEQVRGFLSDRFRRLDSRPLLDAFVAACQKLGAVPIDGFALDTKVRMRAVLPLVFEPVDNEVMLFGMQWGNSDFGDGGHCLSLWNMRVWCTNTAVTDEVLRQVHLGKRLDDHIAYSQRTYELDTKANASALSDVVLDALAPAKINQYLEDIREAVENKLDEKDVTRILKAKLNKGEAEKVGDLFLGQDVVNLPHGRNAYRLSNAISWFSQGEGITENRKLQLQEIAGTFMSEGIKAKEI